MGKGVARLDLMTTTAIRVMRQNVFSSARPKTIKMPKTSLGAVDTVFSALEAICLGQTHSSALRNVASFCDLPVRSHLAKQVLLI